VANAVAKERAEALMQRKHALAEALAEADARQEQAVAEAHASGLTGKEQAVAEAMGRANGEFTSDLKRLRDDFNARIKDNMDELERNRLEL
jgi:hypothetical protein